MTDLVVFDLDGVLIDSRRANRIAFRRGLEQAGLPSPSEEAVTSLVGLPALEMLRRLGCPPEQCPEVFQRWVRPAYLEALEEGTEAMPGAREALQRLRQAGLRLAACTSGTRDIQEAVLRATGLREYLERLHTPCASSFRKPDPAFLRELLEGFSEVGRVFHVEDTAEGIRMGAACGAITIFALYGYGRPGGCRPHHRARSPAEVAEIVLASRKPGTGVAAGRLRR